MKLNWSSLKGKVIGLNNNGTDRNLRKVGVRTTTKGRKEATQFLENEEVSGSFRENRVE